MKQFPIMLLLSFVVDLSKSPMQFIHQVSIPLTQSVTVQSSHADLIKSYVVRLKKSSSIAQIGKRDFILRS